MKRRGLGVNNLSIEAIARDARREAEAYDKAGMPERAAERRQQAYEIRQSMTSYRSRGIQKRNTKTGKIKRYTNLKVFNQECGKYSANGKNAMICDLINVKALVDGSGMATVKVRAPSYRNSNADRAGTWRLHFADHGIMLRHLKDRVHEDQGVLLGAKPRRRR